MVQGGLQNFGNTACHDDVGVQGVQSVVGVFVAAVVGQQAPDHFIVSAEAAQQGVA